MLGAPALKICDVQGIKDLPWWAVALIALGILVVKPLIGLFSEVWKKLTPEWV